ncbi:MULTISPECIES: hypothetical protein [unclassified Caulobacter]|jgi:hypothetical protein|uniref:hypothetical protein n=1 Tax=unclassified Caulobacter TaxID=2648921 RepID=UPI000B2DDBCB|nr:MULTISPECIES: hypothetical protein [unclassified Caulobacter]
MTSDSPATHKRTSPCPWRDRLLHWKDRTTWHPTLTQWLQPHFVDGGYATLSALPEQDLCWDDTDWLDEILAPYLKEDLEVVLDQLSTVINRAVLRAFHGCRVADAGVFHREGIRLNDPAVLEDEARRIVAETAELAWMQKSLESRLAAFDARERDTDQLFLCADDQVQLDHIGHYMLYGSEWMTCALGPSAFDTLRRRGIPTMIEVDLPVSWISPGLRDELAEKLLQEWVRVVVNAPTFIPKIDFGIDLRVPVPAEMIVAHYHPAILKDPYNGNAPCRTEVRTCPSCA